MLAITEAINRKYIYYNWLIANDNDNFTILKLAEMLSELTHMKWSIEKVPADYALKPGEYVVDRWERQVTGKTIGHFRLPDWDSLADSQTVKYGKIVSRRVFRRVG
ncbi:MAG: hypothetical protein LBG90_05190 [Spirochaetaceae bacterium]|jgi:hypothetical protein|nr:hypothetical protein [Spirochaetaceae bacterium]